MDLIRERSKSPILSPHKKPQLGYSPQNCLEKPRDASTPKKFSTPSKSPHKLSAIRSSLNFDYRSIKEGEQEEGRRISDQFVEGGDARHVLDEMIKTHQHSHPSLKNPHILTTNNPSIIIDLSKTDSECIGDDVLVLGKNMFEE
jgi:hypothetical protein